MLSQLNVQLLQLVYNKTYNCNLVSNLKDLHYSDAHPFNEYVHLGYTVNNNSLRDVFLTVQTKTPPKRLAEYHAWIRPLSKELYLATDDGFKQIDEVYSYLNGGTGWYSPTTVLDDTRAW